MIDNIEELPEEVDRSGVANTAAAISNFTLQEIVPALNKVIENQRTIIKELRQEMPEKDGTPRSSDFAREGAENGPSADGVPAGDGAVTDPEDIFAEPADISEEEKEALEASKGEIEQLATLLQDLDSRATKNLADEGYADPDALREATDEELMEVSHVADVALARIRKDFPGPEAETE